jgi:hypothetical protein
MKKLLYLIPLLLSIFACGAQPQTTQNVTNIVNATLTAIAQNNPQVVLPQATFTPISVQVQPTAIQQVMPEERNFTLSLDILRNGVYRSPDWGEFQLSDGKYYRTPPTSQESPETYSTHLLDTVLYGDINLDGLEDAIVFLSTQNGGTGHFIEMAAVLNLNGSAHNVSTLDLGDRVVIESGSIQDGLITLNLRVHGPNDGLCCPSQSAIQNFYLHSGQLLQILEGSQPAAPEAWTTFNHGDYTLSYPSTYSIDPTDRVIVITDSRTTYDSWHNDSVDNSGLLIQLASLRLDRRLDPYKDSSQLATLEQALQREINNIGIPYEVSGSTDVPWENAGGGGGTSEGTKMFYPSVSYQNTILGTTSAAKVISDNKVHFFILVPNDDSYFLRITVQPASSVLIKVADQILSTFTFTH